MAVLDDLVQLVAFQLGNRPDLTQPVAAIGAISRIELWLKNAYVSLGMGQSFSEMESTLTFTTTVGLDNYAYPTTVRAIKSLVLSRPDGTVILPARKDIQYIRRYASVGITSAPAIWAPFSSLIFFRPAPDMIYTATVDFWAKPVISGSLGTTPILLPDDWLEALTYDAAMRGHTELGEPEKARALAMLLYGFTDPQTGKFTPGMLQNLSNRMQAEAPFEDWGVQPKDRNQNYTAGGR